MTINPKKIRAQVAAHATLLEGLAPRLAVAIHNANLAALDPKSLDQRPRPADAGIRSIGAISDPTADQALQAIGIDDRIFDLFAAHMETLRLATAHLVSFAEEWAPVLGERTRCHGGRTVDAWSDPTCTNWAALTAAGRPRGDGLCDACRKRKERHERRQEGAA